VVLQAVGLRQQFGPRVALDGVTIAARPGVLTGLLGPNGAGKTTFMRVLLGVIEPDDGEVLLDGRRITFGDRRRWGYMPQERGLYPTMKAGDQLVYMARLHGLGRADAVARARDILAELGLADRWDERTERLSGGMQQRLQLGASLVHDPDVIVLDEPFAGLDPVAVEELSVSLRQRAAAGRTVLFSSHQLDLVQDLCEAIIMIDHGRTVLEGDVATLRAASGRRQLRLSLSPGAGREWLAAFPGAHLVSEQADELRLELPADLDALQVLDAARAVGTVTDFGLDLPTLSQVFLDAVASSAQGGGL
jgi:ABC-2 type transport system ATP-binding protein